MNPDNPYAAPQTINRPLPVAEEHQTERRLYPELNTVELERLWKSSRAMFVINSVYGVIVGLLIMGLTLSLIRLGESSEHRRFVMLMIFGIVLPLGIRTWWGSERRSWMRYPALVFDGFVASGVSLGTLFLAWMTWVDKVHIILIGISAIFGGLLALGAFQSFFANKNSPEIFVNPSYSYQLLDQELSYRDQYDID